MGGVEGECFRFLLLGKTGSGKSTTGNTILGAHMFGTAATFGSHTDNCERQMLERDGRKIEVLDSPGLYDTHKTQEEVCTTIVQAVAGMHPGPHAVLYVVGLGRYTDEEFGAYTRLKALFDQDITRYVVVVFTHGDQLERQGETVQSMLADPKTPPNLQTVMHECGHRYVVFNNVAQDPKPQVEQLLAMTRQLVMDNGGQPYACPKYAHIGQGMETEVARRLEEVEKADLQRQRLVQELERKTEEAEMRALDAQTERDAKVKDMERQMAEDEERNLELEREWTSRMAAQEEERVWQQAELARVKQEQEEALRRRTEMQAAMTRDQEEQAKREDERLALRKAELELAMREQEEAERSRREEGERRRQDTAARKQNFLHQMEAQREKDRAEVAEREAERERVWAARRAADAEAAEARREAEEEEMERLKQQVAQQEQVAYAFLLGLVKIAVLIVAKVPLPLP